MQLYKQRDKNLSKIKEKDIELERNLQELVENNLKQIFGLKFISTEFPIENFRIDTLAYNEETDSFVIIEYKRSKSFSVIDQGYAYLAAMLNNKADFILKYKEKCNDSIKRKDIDWSQSRIIFLANSFTRHQKKSIGFQDLPMELWEVKKYENSLISFSKVDTPKGAESINAVAKGKDVKRVSKEVREYSVDDHFKEGRDKPRELFEEFSERVLSYNSKLEINPVKSYIGFKIDNAVVFLIKVRSSRLRLQSYYVNPKDLRDPENRTEYKKTSSGGHKYIFEIKKEEDIDYAIMLIKQAVKKFRNDSIQNL